MTNQRWPLILMLGVACAGKPPDDSPGQTPLPSGGTASGGSLEPRAGAAGSPVTGGQSATSAGTGPSTAGEPGASLAGASGSGTLGGAAPGGAGNSAGAPGGGGGDGGSPGVTPCPSNRLAECGGSPLACHFGGEPGNYEVTVQLGEGGQDEVEAEYFRRMLTRSSAAGGWFSFVTNVRVYEGEPLRPDQDSATSKGIPGLDVYFRGWKPSPLSICYRAMTQPPMLWIEGDSTVTDQESADYSGWGQHLPQHFVSPISVANYADSGESSASVLASAKLWGAIEAGMHEGDWVMLQLGHNDKETAADSFRANLLRMIEDTKSAGAHMILVTPISRVGYTLEQEHVNAVGANLPQIIRDLGKSQSVPVIDLTVTTWNWLQTIQWQDYFALGTDRTHTNPQGAEVVSGFVRDAVRAQVPELARYLR